jgi:2'-5' RNA ligase
MPSMAQAIQLLLGDVLDAHVRAQWRLLADAGLPNEDVPRDRRRRPHLTLAVTDELPEVALDDLRRGLRSEPLELRLESLAVFPGPTGVLYLSVTPTTALLDLHAAVLDVLDRRATEVWPFYCVGRWTPHCTLSRGLAVADVPRAVALLQGREATTGPAGDIGVADTETGRLRSLDADPWTAPR